MSIAMRAQAILVALVLGTSCATTPTTPSDSPTPVSNVDVFIVFTPVAGANGVADFSAQLAGQTYTLPGSVKATLSTGVHDISGSFRGAGLQIAFAAIAEGGAKSGSIVNMAGPAPSVGSCRISYATAVSTSANFQMRFEVTDSKAAACGPPPP